MKRSAATWKRVAMSLRGLKEQPRSSHGSSTARRQLRVERLQARELLAADTLHEPVLQYTGGITVAGEVASPDVNQDGNIDPLDALVIANALNASWGVEQLPAADLNQDQQLDHQDFTSIVQTLQQQGNLVAAKGVQADAAAIGNGTVLDDTCAANEITIAMLQDHVDVLKAELAVTVDPMQRAFLEANIASFESSIASLQEDLNCGSGGGDDSGEDDGSGTAGSEGTAGSGGSGGTVGSEGTAGSGGSGGGSPDGPPDPPPTDPPDEPTNETPNSPPTDDPVDPEPPTDPGDPPSESPDDPSDDPRDEQPGDLPPLPPGDPDIPPELPDDTPTGGGTDGTLGGPIPPELPPTDIPPDEIPPSDDPPAEIPPDEIPPGEGTLGGGGGGNTGATEFYVTELKIVPQGYSQGIHGSQVPPLHEAEIAEISGTIDGPRLYGELLSPPRLTLQADLNSDGDYDDPGEQTHIESGPTNNDAPASFEPFYNDEFYWSVPLADDGPVPGDGEQSNVITVRAFFGELGELSDEETSTSNNRLPTDNDPGPDEIPEPPADDGPRITATSANVHNVDPYWTRAPEFSWQWDDDGNSIAHWDIGFNDVGKQDAHLLQVRWGDSAAELLDATPVIHDNCDDALQGTPCTQEQTVLVAQQAPASAPEAESVTLTVADDDTGTAQYTILNLNVLRNNDDDDGNDRPDLLDPGHETENDLVQLDLSELVSSEMDPQSVDYREGDFHFQYNARNIRIWDSPTKEHFILPSDLLMEDALDTAYELYQGTQTISYAGQTQVWVEGLLPSVNDIHLAYSFAENLLTTSDHPRTTFVGRAHVTVWGIDVDIDSDNNDGFNFPKNTQWEEYIESHPFSIGKLIEPDASHFTPIRLRLPPGLDPFDPSIRIDIDNTNPGYLSLWNTHKADPNRDIENFLPLGDFILAELNYDPATGGITVWAEALTGLYDKMRDIAIKDIAEHLVTARLTGPQFTESLEDEVKYKPVNPDSFFPRYIQERSWRNAVAADLVYGDRGPLLLDTPENNADPINGRQYGLRLVTEPELREILANTKLDPDEDIDANLKNYIVNVIYYYTPTEAEPWLDGKRDLRVGLYRDYNSGDYTLSYQGTNFYAFEDWLINLTQGVGASTPQYVAAQQLASKLTLVDLPGLNLTGQSLGGGYASAGSLASGIHADTFNAAGLSFETLWEGSNPDSGTEIVAGSTQRYANSTAYVSAYHVWMNPLRTEPSNSFGINVPDILTFLQRNTKAVVTILGITIPNMPNAVGRPVPIEGEYNIDTVAERTAWEGGWEAWTAYDYGRSATFEMGISHLFPSIYYGLMHGFNADGTEWNVYDNRAPR